MRYFRFNPVDSWFFRDGRPFNSGESSQRAVDSLFPPHAATLVGALRAALARQMGWDGCRDWRDTLGDVLGPSPRDLGPLRVTGPHLLLTRDGAERVLVPLPRCVLGKADNAGVWRPEAVLAPGSPVRCDLGGGEGVRLPTLRGKQDKPGLKEGQDWWVTLDGLAAVLRGNWPDAGELVEEDDLWKIERRVGLARVPETRIAREGMLYSPGHVRLCPGVALGVGLAWATEPDREVPGLGRAVVPLGGEGRVAEVHEGEPPRLPGDDGEAMQNSDRPMLVLLTPLRPGGDWWKTPGAAVPGLDGYRVVSGCVDRPVGIGGWDSLEREPLPLRQMLPAGSVWFLGRADGQAAAAPLSQSVQLGEDQAWGLGHAAVGRWNDKEES